MSEDVHGLSRWLSCCDFSDDAQAVLSDGPAPRDVLVSYTAGQGPGDNGCRAPAAVALNSLMIGAITVIHALPMIPGFRRHRFENIATSHFAASTIEAVLEAASRIASSCWLTAHLRFAAVGRVLIRREADSPTIARNFSLASLHEQRNQGGLLDAV